MGHLEAVATPRMGRYFLVRERAAVGHLEAAATPVQAAKDRAAVGEAAAAATPVQVARDQAAVGQAAASPAPHEEDQWRAQLQSRKKSGVAALRAWIDNKRGIVHQNDPASLEHDHLRGVLAALYTGASAIERLEDIDEREAANLRGRNITTINELWAQLGEDFDHGIDRVSAQASIDRRRLLELLVARSVREAEARDAWLLKRFWRGLKRSRVEIFLFVGILLVAMLFVKALVPRAASAFARLPEPLGPNGPVIVTARDLALGHVLQGGDLYEAQLSLGGDIITSADQLIGAVLAQSIPRGKPLHYADVLRPQVVAASDIVSGTIIASDAISMTWSPYHPGAATQLDQVAGMIAHYPIRRGGVVSIAFVGAAPRTYQLVVAAPAGLPAFHLIGPSDVISREVPLELNTFTPTAEVQGRYTLQALPPGATLHADQLSTVKLAQSDLVGRRVVSVPASADSLGRLVVPGAHLSMLLVPRADAKDAQPSGTSDVIVLAVDRRGASADIVVAMSEQDFQNAQPLLGVSNVVFFRTVPTR